MILAMLLLTSCGGEGDVVIPDCPEGSVPVELTQDIVLLDDQGTTLYAGMRGCIDFEDCTIGENGIFGGCDPSRPPFFNELCE